MSVPTWSEGLDDHGIHRNIFDKRLAEAMPHPDEENIAGYDSKLMGESKGKLVTMGKDKKLRRTALGEGLFKDQQRVTDAVRKFNGARNMKRTAGTRARAGGVKGADIMYAVADGPSPQNINPVRRKVTAAEIHNIIAGTPGEIDIPAHVARLVVTETDNRGNPTKTEFMLTVEDCKELGGDNSLPKQTIPFVTHGVITLACDALERKEMRIGDRVYASTTSKVTFKTNDHDQYNITSVRTRTDQKLIGYYLGPASDRPNGGIVVRLDLAR